MAWTSVSGNCDIGRIAFTKDRDVKFTVDEILRRPVTLRTEDDSTVEILPGTDLPGHLARDTEMTVLPETFLDFVEEPVFMQTNVGDLSDACDMMRDKRYQNLVPRIHESAKEGWSKNETVLKDAARGCELSRRTWQDFTEDCLLLAAAKIARGERVMVMVGHADDRVRDMCIVETHSKKKYGIASWFVTPETMGFRSVLCGR